MVTESGGRSKPKSIFLREMIDIDIDHIGWPVLRKTPSVLVDNRARHGLLRALHQEFQKHKLLLSEIPFCNLRCRPAPYGPNSKSSTW